MKWREIAVMTTQEAVEAVANIFQETGAGGVVIHDPALILSYIEQGKWDYFAFPPEVLEQGWVTVKGYFPVAEGELTVPEAFYQRIDQLKKVMPGQVRQLTEQDIREEEWAESWKAYFKPEKIGARLVVAPPWENYRPIDDEILLEIDPGMAFGTGNHPTTAMVLRAMETYVTPGDVIYDVGTGSGILAIAAVKLGAAKVTAFDHDEVAVQAAFENIERNNVAHQVTVAVGNLLDDAEEQADGILANIIADVILRLNPAAWRKLKSGGYYITSGIIKDRMMEIMRDMGEHNFQVVEVKQEGEWACLIARKS